MTVPDHHRRGGTALAALSSMPPWQAELILHLRLWCEGPAGQAEVWNDIAGSSARDTACDRLRSFEALVRLVTTTARRPLVRHDIGCACAGADECVFAHLVATASDGHIDDAALIATLLASASHCEHIALLAAEVGQAARHSRTTGDTSSSPTITERRLH